MNWTKLVGLGEAMVRLTSPPGLPLPAVRQLDVSVGGAELNALVAACMAGMPATWVTALPDNPMGHLVRRASAASGVDVRQAGTSGSRLGLYFVDSHSAPQPSQVVYDRAESAFALIDVETIQWATLLDGQTCLVLSGITPALGTHGMAALHAAVDAARTAGAWIAFDVNFRSSLWSAEECFATTTTLLPHIDVLSASRRDLSMLGVDSDDPYAAALEAFDLHAVVGTSKSYQDATVRIDIVAADHDDVVSQSVEASIIDPVGAGDALFGTFLAALPKGDLKTATNRALGAAVSAYGTAGDFLLGPAWDLNGPAGGVQR